MLNFWHMSKVIVTTDKDYIIFKIPKDSLTKGTTDLTEDQALRILEKGKKEFESGKLEHIADLSPLL